jgi:peroxiredoxin
VRRIVSSLPLRAPAPLSRWLRAGTLALVALAVLLAIAARALAGPPQATPALVGQPAPSFTLPAEHGGHALPGAISVGGRAEHPRLLIFFYTLCAHCLAQTQAVRDATQAEAARGVEPVYISSPAERPDILDAYVSRLNITAPVLLDADGLAAKSYAVRFYPTTVLVDASGTVRGVWLGETGTAPLERAISALSAR